MSDKFEKNLHFDKQNQLEIVDLWVDNFKEGFNIATKVQIEEMNIKSIKNIIICGMGGSGISGRFLEDIFSTSSNLPAKVINNYVLPEYVSNETLVVAISYSGNTEETLSAVKDGLKSNSKIISITSGGELESISQTNKIPLFVVKSGYQPRFGFPLILGTVLGALNNLNLLPQNVNLENIQKELNLYINTLKINVPENENDAKKVANKIFNTIPYIISNWGSIAHRTKSQLNENAKMFAFGEEYPELFHNSISSWSVIQSSKLALVDFFIESEFYDKRLNEKLNFVIENSKAFSEIIRQSFEGSNHLVKLLKAVIFGDYLSVYCALLNSEDPSTIEMIKKLKKV